MADPKELWEARRSAARSVLETQLKHHTREARDAKAAVVYMDGCPPTEGLHLAIRITEQAVFTGRQFDGVFHEKQAQNYQRSIDAIDALTYKEEK